MPVWNVGLALKIAPLTRFPLEAVSVVPPGLFKALSPEPTRAVVHRMVKKPERALAVVNPATP